MKFTLTAIAICSSFIAPAYATPTVTALFAAIEATGTTIVVDAPRICNDKDMMGMYEYTKNVIDQLTVCVANHHGNSDEVFDTLLHESVHIAQACNDGNPLFTAHSIAAVARPLEIETVRRFYPASQFNRELEARVIARDQDEVFVTELIKEHCK
jgi:hypothetical protein